VRISNSSALATALRLADRKSRVFPVASSKAPTCPGGFKAASIDPTEVRRLWRDHPGPLVGVATGDASGITVLDIDAPRHQEAADWYEAHRECFPVTRTHVTRSGGRHLVFQHRTGLRCSAGRPVVGIDVRGDGGYVIWWPSTGLPVETPKIVAPWPDWLAKAVLPPQMTPLPPIAVGRISDRYLDAALRRAVETVATAPLGTRNTTLNRETYSLARLIPVGLGAETIASAMAHAGLAAGLSASEVARTIASALSGGAER
jgi:hypothetical protein